MVKQAHGPTKAVASTACETNSRGRSSGEAEGSGGEAGTRPHQSGCPHGLRSEHLVKQAHGPTRAVASTACEKKVRVMLRVKNGDMHYKNEEYVHT